MSTQDVITLLNNNPNMKNFWMQSKKREVYSRSGKLIIKKVFKLNGELEKVEIIK